MLESVKSLWIEALPNYTQGRHWLRDGDEFCCLGVLCDLFKDELSVNLDSDGIYTYDGSPELLPESLAKKVELDKKDQLRLANMNDNGASFEEIAEWIKENL